MTVPSPVMKGKSTRGFRNKNPGNIDRVKGVTWKGELPHKEGKEQDSRFCVFKTHEHGIRALVKTLVTYATARKARNGTAIDTVREVIDRWAPPVENNTNAYVNAVAREVGVGADQKINILDPSIMKPLVKAIISHECSGLEYEEETLDAGLLMAGFVVGEEAHVIDDDEDVVAPTPRSKPAEQEVVVKEVTTQKAKTATKQVNFASKVAAILGVIGAVMQALVTETPAIVATLPQAKEVYEDARDQLTFLGELWTWLPVVVSTFLAVAVVIIAIKVARATDNKEEVAEGAEAGER